MRGSFVVSLKEVTIVIPTMQIKLGIIDLRESYLKGFRRNGVDIYFQVIFSIVTK